MANRSETDFLVFISSRQSTEMEQARRDAEGAIDGFPNCRVWAFENMPASSESAREYYLRNSARAEFVIWLVGRETTQPVVDEIHACMAGQGRLLAFMLPGETRDELTLRLVEEVSEYAKWCKVDDHDELEEDIRAALSDEINRLVRNPVMPRRELTLKGLHRESVARCKQSLTSLGVLDDIADEITQATSVGFEIILPAGGVVMVVGDHGSR